MSTINGSYLLSICLLIAPFFCTGQETTVGVKSFGKASFNLNNITIGYEKAISKRATIQVNGGVWYSFKISKNEYKDALSPFLSLEYRNYYNILKRAERQKSTQNNSANFWIVEMLGKLPAFIYSKSDPFDKEGALSIRTGWGFQRPLGKKIVYQLQGGIALVSDFKEAILQPHFKTGFSYVF